MRANVLNKDRVIALAVVVVGCAAALASLALPEGVKTDVLGPRVFPLVLGIGLILCGSALLFRSLLSHPPITIGEGGEATRPLNEDTGISAHWPSFLATVLLLFLYAQLIDSVGYLIVTPVFAAAVLIVQGDRSLKSIATASIILTITLYLLFGLVLRVPFPAIGFL